VVWQVIFTDDYEESLDRLAGTSEETARLAKALLLRATTYPENEPPLPGLRIRVAEEHSPDGRSAVRLFYWIENDRVYLAHIEPYDGDEDEEEEAD
jgi:hypothetical protein